MPPAGVPTVGSVPDRSTLERQLDAPVARTPRRGRPVPACPIRDGDPCSLCVPGVSGPQDCGLVYLVTSDPELRAEWNARRRATAEGRRSA
jgi:hypothetical protein